MVIHARENKSQEMWVESVCVCVCGGWGKGMVLNRVVRKILTEKCQLDTVQSKEWGWHKDVSEQKGKGECKFPEADSDSGFTFDKDGDSGGSWQNCVMIWLAF